MAPPGGSRTGKISSALFKSGCPECASDIAAVYRRLARLPSRPDPSAKSRRNEFEGFISRRNGERIALQRVVKHTRHTHYVIDCLVDHWAARVESLNQCVPIREFTPEDTKKLCWAALEIGKLVEREISYRANHSDDPIPLTAMEFYRIPISDLSFVDGLQARRANAKKVKVHIDHHLQNTLYTMRMQDSIQFKSRVKSHRSYLGRLGERHEGFVRGNLAVWFYLLSLSLLKMPNRAKDTELRLFRKALSLFGKDVERLLKQGSEIDPAIRKNTATNISRLAGQLAKILGDARFGSPPFSEIRNIRGKRRRLRLKSLQRRVVRNLRAENLLDAGNSRPKRGGLKWEGEAAVALEKLIFRNYDSYAVAAASLLCQLVNLGNIRGYLAFYEGCFNLRNLLASSDRDIEDTPQFGPLRDLFRRTRDKTRVTKKVTKTVWVELLEFVETHDTDAFEALTGLPGPKLWLSPSGIYKRIRNLSHTLWQQRDVAHLDWDLGRFDLLGCRLNCLYKSQVFATYEQLWNRGDPFFGMNTERMDKTAAQTRAFFEERPHVRQRWLCTRTKYFKGADYHALQIGALVDPRAVHEAYWDDDGYNLKRVRLLMGRMFADLDPKSADEYKRLARARHHLRWEYGDWFEVASEAVRSRAIPDYHPDDVMLGVGSFLGEAAVDYLMGRLDRFRTASGKAHPAPAAVIKEARDAMQSLWKSLLEVLRFGEDYSKQLEACWTGRQPAGQAFSFDVGGMNVVGFRDATSSLYSAMTKLDRDGRTLVIEKEHYAKVFRRRRIGSKVPLIFVRSGTCRRLRGIKAPMEQDSWVSVYWALNQFRREQRDYLFTNLERRTNENVLQRLQNYVLLCDQEYINKCDRGHADKELAGWTSYDLFYYLRSLIPAEIQIRTMLADTMAEQYHGPVYKGSPPKGTEFAREQMTRVAVQLDNLDKELEIDFEDYMNRYHVPRRSE